VRVCYVRFPLGVEPVSAERAAARNLHPDPSQAERGPLQLLCYLAARSAVWRHSSFVEHKDLLYAVQGATDEAHSDIRLAYDLAIRANGKTSFRDALFLAARCPTDEFGTFRAADGAALPWTAGCHPVLLSLQRVRSRSYRDRTGVQSCNTYRPQAGCFTGKAVRSAANEW
jgi:hypothetical protein